MACSNAVVCVYISGWSHIRGASLLLLYSTCTVYGRQDRIRIYRVIQGLPWMDDIWRCGTGSVLYRHRLGVLILVTTKEDTLLDNGYEDYYETVSVVEVLCLTS
ncbi:hypothetical protein F4860DRAFT_1415 [Xylaria cubensis]|nr:hypothetical protein F4860DRAFT_1415 [Xylaria cubensis]